MSSASLVRRERKGLQFERGDGFIGFSRTTEAGKRTWRLHKPRWFAYFEKEPVEPEYVEVSEK
ncbi:MAG: hypothetical protein AABX38_05715, partial [Candidatus Micrarchaeota archaeon]